MQRGCMFAMHICAKFLLCHYIMDFHFKTKLHISVANVKTFNLHFHIKFTGSRSVIPCHVNFFFVSLQRKRDEYIAEGTEVVTGGLD